MDKERKRSGSIGKIIMVFFLLFCFYFASVVLPDEKRFFQTESSTLSLDVLKPAKWPFQNFKLPMVRKLIISFAAVPALKTLPMDEKRFFQTQSSTLSLDVLKPANWLFQNFKLPMVRKLIVSFAAVPALKSAISAFPELPSSLKSERMYNLAIFGPQAADLIRNPVLGLKDLVDCADMIATVAMLSDMSAPTRLLYPRQLFDKDNLAETFDLIRNRVSGFKDHACYADWLVEVEGSVEGRDRSIGGVIWPSELTAPQTGRFGDPVEFGSSQVRDSVEHRGENSSGAGGSGAENAGEERNRSRGGGGNGNEGIGGGRQGSGNEGRQGGLGAGGHGGDNGDDGGNNGRDRIGDIENGRIPPRNPRREELVEMYLPIIIQLIGIVFALDEANLSALGSVLRCFALVCCIWGIVFFTGSLFERGRNETAAGNWSRIGSTFAVLGLISIIALKLPLNLLFITVLAFLVLLAIVFRSFRTGAEGR